MSKKKDLRSSLAKSRDEFFNGKGNELCRGAPSGQYLRSRLIEAYLNAYLAGWNDREKQIKERRRCQ